MASTSPPHHATENPSEEHSTGNPNQEYAGNPDKEYAGNPTEEHDSNPVEECNPEVACLDNPVVEHAMSEGDEVGQATPYEDGNSAWVIFLLAAVSAVEGADMSLLPACSFALQVDLGLSLGQLAKLNIWQGLCGCFAAPVWGILADRQIMTRRAIITLGCFGWGICSILLAIFDSWSAMVVIRSWNGIFLACLRPISNGLVPDICPAEEKRGAVFGRIQFAMDVGTMVSAMVATPVSTQQVMGIQGWRATFIISGITSAALALLVGSTMAEPKVSGADTLADKRAEADAVEGRSGLRKVLAVVSEEACRLCSYFKIPTFNIIILQGLFGMIFWSALGNMTLFFQTAGVSDFMAAFLTTLNRAAGAIGHLGGGYIGDFASTRWRLHGRPFIAQISVASGIPIVYLMFSGIEPTGEPNGDAIVAYAVLAFLLGAMATWCAAGVNWPIFCEIVPEEGRSTVVAWDTALEGISGTVIGSPVVAFLADNYFGYSQEAGIRSQTNAYALGQGLMWTTSVPMLICLAFYSLMHWSYPRDLHRIQAKPRKDRTQSDFGCMEDLDSDNSSRNVCTQSEFGCSEILASSSVPAKSASMAKGMAAVCNDQ